jgi:hypothetical protein
MGAGLAVDRCVFVAFSTFLRLLGLRNRQIAGHDPLLPVDLAVISGVPIHGTARSGGMSGHRCRSGTSRPDQGAWPLMGGDLAVVGPLGTGLPARSGSMTDHGCRSGRERTAFARQRASAHTVAPTQFEPPNGARHVPRHRLDLRRRGFARDKCRAGAPSRPPDRVTLICTHSPAAGLRVASHSPDGMGRKPRGGRAQDRQRGAPQILEETES